MRVSGQRGSADPVTQRGCDPAANSTGNLSSTEYKIACPEKERDRLRENLPAWVGGSSGVWVFAWVVAACSSVGSELGGHGFQLEVEWDIMILL
jgi:hypothetical protein